MVAPHGDPVVPGEPGAARCNAIDTSVRCHHGGMTEPADRLRRRIEEIFGDDHATTADERSDGGSAEERDDRDPDRWFTENRPPHHGG
ncbi:hypothetical protein Ae168Ps1_3982 [Pseudonocardia sp. Ae168_Ps1]|jgi:hypothetical protein|nr:hypothetical protein FRP1_22910 [Pseudonocardia sp. EC080625-04]ALL74412.1 hypothetical protein AD006_02095 [Pseudonocardia sp. EC080610-09]ALL81434.1 hypothetical protein AD017_09920 [Pseudonocardia sp. EC080619-01]OLL75581.1 hypothetical protein Ae150APs1_3959 [Pseudonocardia sp. Ae150A_Ps1]OLL81576.1 hypothetical protein Ae168Ps1_3982 [Pseudonocardia sp. Ae168_Ps1]OLL84311.1 hypothetical protein Ae263Ps1_1366c [Pseudonocardia sp. Ae263_Ps1]OLL95671.1 hypothetical protein Ae356Ps1_5568 [